MAKQPQIRWRQADEQELKRLHRNYLANLNRHRRDLIAQDRRYEAANLPPKISYKDLKAGIKTRKDFQSEINRLEAFNKQGRNFVVDQRTEKSLTATVRDYNAKIDRLSAKAKTQAEKAALPAKISKDQLIKNAAGIKDLKANIKIHKGFLEKGAEELVDLPGTKFNIKTTKWQKETMEKLLIGINEKRAEELEAWKEAEVTYGGKKAGYKQGQARLHDDDFDQFQPMNMYTYSSTYTDLKMKLDLMIREKAPGYWNARAELARINYIETMDRIIGDTELGKYMIKHLDKLPVDAFKRTLKSEDDLWLHLYDLEINDPLSQGYETLLQTVWGEWFPDQDMYETLDKLIDKKTGGH